MELNDIVFYIRISNPEQYAICLSYLSEIINPENYRLKFIPIYGTDDIGRDYNINKYGTDAAYSLYMYDTTLICDKDFLNTCIEIFKNEPLIGALGITEEKFMKMNVIENLKHSLKWEYVNALNRNIIITKLNLPWKENFSSNAGVEIEYCLRVKETGFLCAKLNIENQEVILKREVINWKSNLLNSLEETYRKYYIAESIKENDIMLENIKLLIKKETDIGQKLLLIQYAAYFACFNFSGKYSDKYLEDELYKISNRYLKDLKTTVEMPDTVLHVMTAAYETGGHTRIVYNWINFSKEKKHSIVFTDKTAISPEWLQDMVKKNGGEILYLTTDGYLEKSKELFYLSSRYQKIVLHIHPYDIIPLITYSHISWRKTIYFFNHSGHTFWLGMSISDIIVGLVETDDIFLQSRRGLYKGGSRTIALPYKIDNEKQGKEIKYDCSAIKADLNIPVDSKVIVSMAPDWRFTQTKKWNFDEFIVSLINEVDDLYIIIIGNSDNGRWQALREKSNDKIIPLGTLEKSNVKRIFSIANLYVDSFYHGSPGCVLDAFDFGLSVMGVRTEHYWMQEFNYKTVDELHKAVIDFFRQPEKFNRATIYEKYKAYYSMQKCKLQMTALYNCEEEHKYNAFLNLDASYYDENDMMLAVRWNDQLRWTDFFSAFNNVIREELLWNIFSIYIQKEKIR